MIQNHTRATKHTLLPTNSNIINNNNNMALTYSDYTTSSSSATSSDGDDSAYDASPMIMSPWNPASPLPIFPPPPPSTLIASLRRNDGHVYSLAAKDGLLYTGSGSKNIRVWNNMQESDAFKSTSGFVKAIVISGDRIFTGHHDGRIRIWKSDGTAAHKQIGTLPTFVELLKASMRPKSYVKVKRNRKSVWMKHADAISGMSMDEEEGLLYSSSWDRTFKVWRIKDSKCVESVAAHDDAVNAVVAGGGGVVYTGSADSTVKAWRREVSGKAVRHFLWRTLLRLDCAVTALAVGGECAAVVYAGSSDGLVNFWEVKKEEVAHGGVLKSHQLAVLCLAAAGSLVVSGGADKTIGVWRREGVQHTMLTVLFGHTEPVKCLAVEEDGDGGDRKWKVYSGSLDKSVKVWSVSETCSISSSTHLSKFHHKIW